MPAHNTFDTVRQMQAIMSADVAQNSHGSLAEAAKLVRAKTLIVASRGDTILNHGPAMEFARLLDSESILFENETGHALATDVQNSELRVIIEDFLKQ
jgi:homoserine acetyltransferase